MRSGKRKLRHHINLDAIPWKVKIALIGAPEGIQPHQTSTWSDGEISWQMLRLSKAGLTQVLISQRLCSVQLRIDIDEYLRFPFARGSCFVVSWIAHTSTG